VRRSTGCSRARGGAEPAPRVAIAFDEGGELVAKGTSMRKEKKKPKKKK
jgi:hypothetical protein